MPVCIKKPSRSTVYQPERSYTVPSVNRLPARAFIYRVVGQQTPSSVESLRKVGRPSPGVQRVKMKYGDNAKLLFTGTDSLAYEIKNKNFNKDINTDSEKRFDTSDYPTNHPSGIKTGLNSKGLGMFKDEAGENQIVEFVCLRAKLYSYKMLYGSEDKKCKGVSKNVTKMSIQFDDYRECLFSRKKQQQK